MIQTTINLKEEHMEYFKNHPEISMSGTIRKLLDDEINGKK
jgi:hypothetical protein